MDAHSPANPQHVIGVGGSIYYKGFSKRESLARDFALRLLLSSRVPNIEDAIDQAVKAADYLIDKLKSPISTNRKKRKKKKAIKEKPSQLNFKLPPKEEDEGNQAEGLPVIRKRQMQEDDASRMPQINSKCSYRRRQDGDLFKPSSRHSKEREKSSIVGISD